ncbi:MAG TPA: hypothetical protein DDW45_02350, partial [Gammaproteobacteria bacterium]|nr:hypothetical protein [Gammaproteobacteria bacterium]
DQVVPRLDQSIPPSFSAEEGVIYQWLTGGIRIALPPNSHPMDLFRGSLTIPPFANFLTTEHTDNTEFL